MVKHGEEPHSCGRMQPQRQARQTALLPMLYRNRYAPEDRPARVAEAHSGGHGRLAVVLAAISLAACATRPAPHDAFPPAPMDLKAPLPTASSLPPLAKLSDVMTAHLNDDKAIADLRSEALTWRDWYVKQAREWNVRP